MSSQKFKGIIAGGMPSSGSTLLSLMLDSHPDITCGPELTFFSHNGLLHENGLSPLRISEALFTYSDIDYGLPWSKCDEKNLGYFFVEKSEIINMAGVYRNLVALFDKVVERRMLIDGSSLWVEKSPQNIYGFSPAIKNNVEIGGILTIRHPLAVIDSLVRRGFREDTAIRQAVFDLSLAHFLIQDPLISARTCVIRFESLMLFTKESLVNVCNFLGINEAIDAMSSVNQSPRIEFDTSLLRESGGAANSWQYLPSEPINPEVLEHWKLKLTYQRLETFKAMTATKQQLEKYVDSAEEVNGADLCSLFGYDLDYEVRDKTPYFRINGFYRDKSVLPAISNIDSASDENSPAIPRSLPKRAFWAGVRFVEWLATKNLLLKKIRDVLAAIVLKIIERYPFYMRKIKRQHSISDEKAEKVDNWCPPDGGEQKYDVAVIIAFQDRHEVLELIIGDLCSQSTLLLAVVLACSNDKDSAFCKNLQDKYKNIGYVQCSNKPLGNKWQNAVDHARLLNPGSILITGSDDYVTPGFIEHNFKMITNRDSLHPSLIGPRSWYMVSVREKNNPKVWKVSYKNTFHLMPLGAGRMYSRDFLDSIDWQIFNRNLEALLDDQGYEKIIEKGNAIYNPVLEDGAIISVKGNWGAMNSVEAILGADSIICSELFGSDKQKILKFVRPLCH